MRLVMRAYDAPEKLNVRDALMAAHLDYLSEHANEILVAGSLREEADGHPVGALWILEVGSLARAKALIESDPFYKAGLRSRYELLHWSKAFSHPIDV